eukprot:COSAG05_NODE_393_length_10383_cov_34.037923_2_plen_101_part_00
MERHCEPSTAAEQFQRSPEQATRRFDVEKAAVAHQEAQARLVASLFEQAETARRRQAEIIRASATEEGSLLDHQPLNQLPVRLLVLAILARLAIDFRLHL